MLQVQDLDLDSPGLVAVLEDSEAMDVFQQLRIQTAPATVETLSRLVSHGAARVQKCVDLLCDAGLVSIVRADRSHRTIRYRPVGHTIRVCADFTDPSVLTRIDAFVHAERERVRRYVDSCEALSPEDRPQWRYFGLCIPRMTGEELAELRSRVQMIQSFLAAIEDRTRRTQLSDGEARSRPGTSRQHAVTLQVQPLRSSIPSLPPIEFVARDSHSAEHSVSDTKVDSLAPRERQIAQLLADGLSRPQIAQALGVSIHTVVTMSSRIYRKLGVRTRAHLARMMSG
jgi:DNA-binding CsgD family transcriptional regulator